VSALADDDVNAIPGRGGQTGRPEEELAYRVRRPPAGPSGALVLLHGRGTDEHDLAPLLDELDPERRLIGLTPRAPLELSPGGYYWYIVRELGHPDAETFLETYRRVGGWLDELPSFTGVPLERTALGGFSQGAVMTYALGLGAGRPALGALIALSGFMPEAPGLVYDLEGHRDVPIAIGHGAHDHVIPAEYSREAGERLRRAGLDVLFRESPMFHGIDPNFVGELSRWLPSRLERRAAA
jgi:phospholipase/carboxylesterase